MAVLYACAHMQLQLDICAYDFPYTYQLISFMYIYIYNYTWSPQLAGDSHVHWLVTSTGSGTSRVAPTRSDGTESRELQSTLPTCGICVFCQRFALFADMRVLSMYAARPLTRSST